MKPILLTEKKATKNDKSSLKLFANVTSLFKRHDLLLKPQAKTRLQRILAISERLRLVYQYRISLQNVWTKTASSQRELVEALQAWCKQAEESGIDVLKMFAMQMKHYIPRTV